LKTPIRHTAAAWFSLFVYTWMFFLGATGSVLCISADGHIAVESIDKDCCPDSYESAKTTDSHSESSESHESHEKDCGNCFDAPLSTPFFYLKNQGKKAKPVKAFIQPAFALSLRSFRLDNGILARGPPVASQTHTTPPLRSLKHIILLI